MGGVIQEHRDSLQMKICTMELELGVRLDESSQRDLEEREQIMGRITALQMDTAHKIEAHGTSFHDIRNTLFAQQTSTVDQVNLLSEKIDETTSQIRQSLDEKSRFLNEVLGEFQRTQRTHQVDGQFQIEQLRQCMAENHQSIVNKFADADNKLVRVQTSQGEHISMVQEHAQLMRMNLEQKLVAKQSLLGTRIDVLSGLAQEHFEFHSCATETLRTSLVNSQRTLEQKCETQFERVLKDNHDLASRMSDQTVHHDARIIESDRLATERHQQVCNQIALLTSEMARTKELRDEMAQVEKSAWSLTCEELNDKLQTKFSVLDARVSQCGVALQLAKDELHDSYTEVRRVFSAKNVAQV